MNEEDLKLRDDFAHKLFDHFLYDRKGTIKEICKYNPVAIANHLIKHQNKFIEIDESISDCEGNGFDYLTNVYEGKGYKDLNNICGNSVQFKDDSTQSSSSRTFISFYLGDKNEKIEDDYYSLDDICFEYVKTTIDAMMPNVKKVKLK